MPRQPAIACPFLLRRPAAISKSKSELWFEALTTLSDSAAESLSTNVGGYVRLQRLKSGISSKALHSLAKAKVFVFLPDNLDRKVQRLKE
jgi:hypothetical protein